MSAPTLPIAVLQELIRIDSVNPDLSPGAAGEGEVASWCEEWLTAHGFEVHRLEQTPGRPSIVGVLRGTGGGRSLMLNAHTDTVGIEGYVGDPFSGELRDGSVYGRGAFDTKGGAAAIMVAAARVAEERPAGDVIVTLVADEEFASIGTEEVLREFTADAAIITEPSNLDLVLAHRGFAWFELELTGRSAHSSMPHQGVDAIAHAGRVMRALDELSDELVAGEPHPLVSYGRVQVSMISGGRDAATVPPSCSMTIERRMLPHETPDATEARLRELLERVGRETPDFSYELTRTVARAGFEAQEDWPIVRSLAANAQRALGREPGKRGEPFWTDAALVLEAGIPCLLVGVDGGGAHADTEWATVESVEQLTDMIEGTIRDFCNTPLIE